jgi:hypothetical protein
MWGAPPKRNLFKKRVGGENSKIRFIFDLTAKKIKKNGKNQNRGILFICPGII